MKSIIRGVAAPLATFAVLIAGAPIASAAEIGESQTATAEALPLSSPVHMAPQPPSCPLTRSARLRTMRLGEITTGKPTNRQGKK